MAGRRRHGQDQHHQAGAVGRTSTVTTIVNPTTRPGSAWHGRSVTERGPLLPAYSDRVSEPTNASDQPTERRPTDLHTESHDPAVPDAYAAFMRTGWGERELDLPEHPIAPHAAPTPGGARRGVPGRAPRAARRDVQGAVQRHRLPLPVRHGAHLLLRQPDHRRRPRHRGRRVGALCPAALRRARPTSSSATASTASCGPAVVPPSARCRVRSGSRCVTSTTSTVR